MTSVTNSASGTGQTWDCYRKERHYQSKNFEKKMNTKGSTNVTPADIFNIIKEMGAVDIRFSTDFIPNNPPVALAGKHVFISWETIQQMTNSAAVKEQILDFIQHNLENPRGGKVPFGGTGLGYTFEWGARFGEEIDLKADYLLNPDKEEEEPKPDFQAKLIENLAAQGNYLAKQNEMYLLEQTSESSETESPARTINRMNMQSVTIESGNSRWEALVSPEGIWIAPEGWQSREEFELIDPSRGVPGIPQSRIRELEHLSKMLEHIPPQLGNLTLTRRDPEDRSVALDTQTINSPDLSLYDRLRQITNAFSDVRDGFGGSNQHIQSTEFAFRHVINNSFTLVGQLARKNFGGGSAEGVDMEIIKQLREDAQRQIDLFSETFLSKFRQYGTEDAFNIAWAQLNQSA